MSSQSNPSRTIQNIISHIESGNRLTRNDTKLLVEAALDEMISLDTFARWLESTAEKSPTGQEIAGVADALRARMHSVDLPDKDLLIGDTCGTGGDGSGTFNISTAAAFVVAATGLPIAKHGNRAVSSRTGSADVLEQLGIQVIVTPDVAKRCLIDVGICFLFAPSHHPALAKLRELRQRIGRPTIFNFVGPLCNPVGNAIQVIGVGRHDAQEPVAKAAEMLKHKRAIVVRSMDGVDEVGLFSETRVLDVSHGRIQESIWHPEDFGLSMRAPNERTVLLASDSKESAHCIRSVLEGERGPRRDIVVMNAAALIWASGRADNLSSATRVAESAIDTGQAHSVLERLQTASHIEEA